MAPPEGTRATTGRATEWATALTAIEPNRILLRGYRLDDVMGRINFGEAIYLLFTGDLPPPSIARLMDAMLVSFIDHGVTPPSTLSARHTVSTGASIRSAVAAGVLGFGPYHGGDALACRALLDEGLALVSGGRPHAEAAVQLAERLVARNELPPPGFGHRYHTIDPRATRLLQIAHELEIDSSYTLLLRGIEHALARHDALAGRAMPINVDGAIAAICGDAGLPPEVADALLIVSRVPGLVAHALEERQRERPMRVIQSSGHRYDGPAERRIPSNRG